MDTAERELTVLPVPDLAAHDAVLWLWATNARLPAALEAVRAWRFTYRTTLTWYKGVAAAGDPLKDQTEQCILAVRGQPTLKTTTKHSTAIYLKGVADYRGLTNFYGLVEAVCPGSKVELFAQRGRPGWVSLADTTGQLTWEELPVPAEGSRVAG